MDRNQYDAINFTRNGRFALELALAQYDTLILCRFMVIFSRVVRHKRFNFSHIYVDTDMKRKIKPTYCSKSGYGCRFGEKEFHCSSGCFIFFAALVITQRSIHIYVTSQRTFNLLIYYQNRVRRSLLRTQTSGKGRQWRRRWRILLSTPQTHRNSHRDSY